MICRRAIAKETIFYIKKIKIQLSLTTKLSRALLSPSISYDYFPLIFSVLCCLKRSDFHRLSMLAFYQHLQFIYTIPHSLMLLSSQGQINSQRSKRNSNDTDVFHLTLTFNPKFRVCPNSQGFISSKISLFLLAHIHESKSEIKLLIPQKNFNYKNFFPSTLHSPKPHPLQLLPVPDSCKP